MKLDPINLIGGFYQDDNLPWSAQDVCNWIPRPAEKGGTISPMKLAGAPGLTFLADIDPDPVRIGGIRNVEGKLFVVAGTTLYEVATDYTTTVRGTIPGAGPVTMQHNQLEFGNELSIGNGSGTLYVWNTWTSTFTAVADDAATGSVQSVYLNRRLIHLDPFGRFLYPSDIDNATAYDALDRADSEASPDKLVGLGVSQFELVGFSQRTTEFYADTGATEQPFRSKKIAINRGCASRQSIVQVGGTLAWLGDDGIFYRLNGYQEQAISTGPVNKAIANDNWANCFGMVWEDRKHEVAYWTFPDGQTWGYDFWTGEMHRRESFGMTRWRVNTLEKWNGIWIGGDFQRGRLYQIDWDAYHEAGEPLVATRTAPPIYNNGNSIVCPMINLVFDTGRSASVPTLSISGDIGNDIVGSSGSFQYQISGGTGPFTFSISSGSLPPGASIDADTGLVTYLYTTPGDFSWTVEVEDALGQTATVPDSNTVLNAKWLAFVNGAGVGSTGIMESVDGITWNTPVKTFITYGIGVNGTSASAENYLGRTFFLTVDARTEGGNPSNRLFITPDVGATLQDTNAVAAPVGGTYRGFTIGGGFLFRIVITGGFAGIWRTPDGVAWTYKPMAAFRKSTALAYKGSRLLSASTARSDTQYSDNNGDTWTDGVDAFPGNNNIFDVAANSTHFFACSQGAVGVGRGVRRSTTGISGWSACAITLSATQEPRVLLCVGDDLVYCLCGDAAGSIFVSTDGGANFIAATGTLGAPVNEIYHSSGRIVATGDNGMLATCEVSNPTVWTQRANTAGGQGIGSIVRSIEA